MVEYYRGFSARIEHYEPHGLFVGFVVKPAETHITVSASTLDDLLAAYRKAVDEYLESHLLTNARAVA